MSNQLKPNARADNVSWKWHYAVFFGRNWLWMTWVSVKVWLQHEVFLKREKSNFRNVFIRIICSAALGYPHVHSPPLGCSSHSVANVRTANCIRNSCQHERFRLESKLVQHHMMLHRAISCPLRNHAPPIWESPIKSNIRRFRKGRSPFSGSYGGETCLECHAVKLRGVSLASFKCDFLEVTSDCERWALGDFPPSRIISLASRLHNKAPGLRTISRHLQYATM